jgi:hypothetical protein
MHFTPGWSFYFTRDTRQSGNLSMAAYEASTSHSLWLIP